MASVSRATPTAPSQTHFQRSSSSRLIQSYSHGKLLRAVKVKIASNSSKASKVVASDQLVCGTDLPRKQPVEDRRECESRLVDWEDLILGDTVPLVGFVRMVHHSRRYQAGDRLNPKHEKIIVEMLLPYHPKYKEKIGFGIDHIKVGNHPDFESTPCLLIVQKDGESVDFSYWKCIKGLIRKKYPLHADTFIGRHFRRHWRRE